MQEKVEDPLKYIKLMSCTIMYLIEVVGGGGGGLDTA